MVRPRSSRATNTAGKKKVRQPREASYNDWHGVFEAYSGAK